VVVIQQSTTQPSHIVAKMASMVESQLQFTKYYLNICSLSHFHNVTVYVYHTVVCTTVRALRLLVGRQEG